MRGLKCQSWCKIRKGNILLGSMGAVPCLMAHHVSGSVNVIYFKANLP